MSLHTRIGNVNVRMLMCLVCGSIAALCVSVGVRTFGHPPGIRMNPLAGLLGTKVPWFQTSGLKSGKVTFDIMSNRPYLLYFTSSDCEACDVMYPHLGRVSSRLSTLIVGVGSRMELVPYDG